MASATLPKKIDPVQLADNANTLVGELNISEMERLKGLLYEHAGSVYIDLKFDRNSHDFRTICGSIKAGLKIICQRCLEPMTLELDIPVRLCLIFSEAEIKRLPKECDPLLLTGEPISLVFLIEDEILLNLPIVPKHSDKECSVKAENLIEWDEESSKKKKTRAFKVLKKLISGE